MVIGKKLAIAGAFLMGLTAILGIVTLAGLQSYDAIVHALADDSLAGVASCSLAESALYEMKADMWRHVASVDAADMVHQEQEIERLRSQIAQTLDQVRAAIFEQEERDINDRIDPALRSFYASWADVRQLSRDKKNAEAYALFLSDLEPKLRAAEEAVKAETEYNRRNGAINAEKAVTTAARVRDTTLAVLGFSILGGGGIFFWIVKSLNLTLRKAVQELTQGATQLATASSQVASSSQVLSQSSQEQAAALEQTSASMNEINAAAKNNTESSGKAANLVIQTQQRFGDTNQSLNEAVSAMVEIDASSSKISKIMKVIDEIAFQTNVLSINAAVEAARAGEAGKGFAVVADAVRNLAHRSAEAASETASLVSECIEKSSNGKRKVEQVSTAIHAITADAGKVKNIVEEMNGKSQKQAEGIAQISKVVGEMGRTTQSVAAGAEEGAAASQALLAQARVVRHVAARLGSLVGGVRNACCDRLVSAWGLLPTKAIREDPPQVRGCWR